MFLQEPFERPPPLNLIPTSLSECTRAAKNASCKVRVASPVALVTDCRYYRTFSAETRKILSNLTEHQS
jgi:hypothetical protein